VDSRLSPRTFLPVDGLHAAGIVFFDDEGIKNMVVE